LTEGPKGTFVVGIRQGEVDLDDIKASLSGIHGVSEVEFNYLTRKFTVHYDGNPGTLEQINMKLDGVIRVGRQSDPPSR